MKISEKFKLGIDGIEIDLTEIKILAIDNNKATLEILYDYLIKSSYKNIKTVEWTSAIKEIKDYNPDLILAGIIHPQNEGMEIIRSINQIDSDTEIIIYTDESEKKLFHEALRLQLCDILTNPICPDDLDHALNRMHNRLISKLEQETFFNVLKEKTEKLKEVEQESIPLKLVQGIIHNLNAPLCAISGNAQLVEHGLDDIEVFFKNYLGPDTAIYQETIKKICKIKSFLNNLSISSDKMKDIVFDFLSKWKKDASSKPDMVDINDLIKIEMNYFNADLEFKSKIRKILALEPNLPKIHGLYSDFSQTFDNLVNNAVKAMNSNNSKELKIISRQDSDNIYIEIYDNGCGIAQDRINRIFDNFYTDWSSINSRENTTKVPGTGVGLSNCRELMRSYGSDFEVKSSIGQGTCFIWKIPKQKPVFINDRF